MLTRRSWHMSFPFPFSSLFFYCVKKSYFDIHLNVTMRVFDFLGCLCIVHAALIFTDRTWTDVVTGVPFAVTWSGNVGAVTLTLDNGTASNPNVVHHIQCKYTSTMSVFCMLQLRKNIEHSAPDRHLSVQHYPRRSGDSLDRSFNLKRDIEYNTENRIFTNICIAGLVSNSFIWTPGLFATPDHEFFLGLNDSTAAQSFSPHFVIAASQSATSTTSTTSTATTSPTTSPSSQTPSSAPSSSSSNGLSSGAKIGIAVGVAGGVIILAVLGALALLWKRRRRNGKRSKSFEMDGTTRYDGFEVLEKSSRGGSKKGIYKLALATDSEGRGTGELEGEGRPAVRHELQ